VSLLAGCAALAVLELDATLIAQTLISRPLVAGAVVGAITGRPQAGVLFGASYELLGLCNLPVGGCMNWSGTVAAGTAAMLSSAGASYSACFAGGLAAGAAHAWIEGFERARRARTGDALAAAAEAGGCALSRSFGASIAAHAAMTFAVAGGAAALIGFADRRWWSVAPGVLQAGASLAASSAPWIGLSGVAMWGLKRA
jgi:mannose/fructose/N-acetylgalactosamine-specific phosphotransferase system component IIC